MEPGDCVNTSECNRKMNDVWMILRGDDGQGGFAGVLQKILSWQTAKDAADEARAKLQTSQQEQVKIALDKHNTRLMIVSVAIALGMLLLAALEFHLALKDHALIFPPYHASQEPQHASTAPQTLVFRRCRTINKEEP